MKTSARTRQLLIGFKGNAKAVPIEVDGNLLVERKSKKAVATVSGSNPKMIRARAKYMARACTIAPFLVSDLEEVLTRVAQAKSVLDAEVASGTKVPAQLLTLLDLTEAAHSEVMEERE